MLEAPCGCTVKAAAGVSMKEFRRAANRERVPERETEGRDLQTVCEAAVRRL